MAKNGNGTKVSKQKLIALGSGKKTFEFTNPLEQEVKYMGEKVKLKVHEDPNGFSYIVWKNKKYLLEIIEKNQNKYTVMINGVWYTFTVETPDSMYGKHWITLEIEDTQGLYNHVDEVEYWFLNPVIALSLEGDLVFESSRNSNRNILSRAQWADLVILPMDNPKKNRPKE